MQLHPVLAVVALVATLVPPTFATTGDGTLRHQSAIVNFEHLTWVGNARLIGPYVIVHDDARMAAEGPCTSLYRVRPGSLPLEEVAAFHCIPRERAVARNITTVIERNPTTGDTLMEYQFEGDTEGHGVPIFTQVSDRQRPSLPSLCIR